VQYFTKIKFISCLIGAFFVKIFTKIEPMDVQELYNPTIENGEQTKDAQNTEGVEGNNTNQNDTTVIHIVDNPSPLLPPSVPADTALNERHIIDLIAADSPDSDAALLAVIHAEKVVVLPTAMATRSLDATADLYHLLSLIEKANAMVAGINNPQLFVWLSERIAVVSDAINLLTTEPSKAIKTLRQEFETNGTAWVAIFKYMRTQVDTTQFQKDDFSVLLDMQTRYNADTQNIHDILLHITAFAPLLGALENVMQLKDDKAKASKVVGAIAKSLISAQFGF
jgi:hypothetical protein